MGGKQIYDLILILFDYNLMKQKIYLQSDQFYKIHVFNLNALEIIE